VSVVDFFGDMPVLAGDNVTILVQRLRPLANFYLIPIFVGSSVPGKTTYHVTYYATISSIVVASMHLDQHGGDRACYVRRKDAVGFVRSRRSPPGELPHVSLPDERLAAHAAERAKHVGRELV
jgi:hypothetical protein